jgi:hypothetical protein
MDLGRHARHALTDRVPPAATPALEKGSAIVGRALLIGFVCALAAVACVTASASARTLAAGNERGDEVVLCQVLFQRTRPLFAATGSPAHPLHGMRALTGHIYPVDESVAVDDRGGAVAAWIVSTPGNERQRVVVAIRRPGARFGAPRTLTPPFRYPENIRLAMNGRGDAVLFWNGARGRLQYSYRAAGRPFARPRPIPGSAGAVGNAVVDPDGGVVAAWTNSGVTRAAYRPRGGTFESGHAVAGVSGGAELSASGAGEALLWWRDGGAVRAVERPPRGEFGQPFTLYDGIPKKAQIDQVELGRGGEVALSWEDPSLAIVVRDASGSWSPPEIVGRPGGAETPRLVLDGRGDLAAVWADGDKRVLAVFRPAGEAFERTRTLAGPRPFAPPLFVRPDLTIDGRGRAEAVWEQSDGAHISAYARAFRSVRTGARRRLSRVRSFTREAPRSACHPRGTRVVEHSRRATLIESTHGYYKGELSGCLFARGVLIDLYSDGTFPPRRLAGPFASYAGDECDPDDCSTVVSVVDLRDESDGLNRIAKAWPTGGDAEVPAIRLRPDGAVAWVSCDSPYGPAYGEISRCVRGTRAQKRVYALDRYRNAPRLLDKGPGINPTSLALAGSRLTWRHSGGTRAARLR